MTIGKRSVSGWLVCYAFMLAFFLVMVPSLAYADTYVATEDSAVRAAMVYLGYDPDEGESTNKLVTAFYDATSGDEYTGWQSFVNGLYQPLATVNYNEQWWSPADGFMFSAQVDRARSDAAKIYAQWKKENSAGSGSGSPLEPVDDYYVIPMTMVNSTSIVNIDGTTYKFNGGTSNYPVYGGTFTVKVPKSHIAQYLTDEYIIYVALTGTNSNSSSNTTYRKVYGRLSIYQKEGFTLTFTDGFLTGVSGTPVRSSYQSGKWTPTTTNGDVVYEFGNNTGPEEGLAGGTVICYATWGYSGDGGDINPEPEPEPEPEPPTPPDPPVDPTPPEPDPTQPSQTVDLQGIIDRLDIIIRNQEVLINWLDDAFSSVTQNIQWLGELIDESFGWLWEVLEKLQASVDGGISRITTWLEMIYRRIGGQGGTVSRPNIDTPTPWDDFLSWLEGILQRLLDLIFGVTPAALQNLLTGLSDLTNKFPFSIPWDLAALFALFAHDPVTPVADIPLMVPYADAPLPIHVDCTTWDSLAAIARDGEVILFAAWLIMKTPDFYRHLNGVSGAD